jgi:hypothetical protein
MVTVRLRSKCNCGACVDALFGHFGLRKVVVGASDFVQFSLRHILPTLQNLWFRLFGLVKRRQPRTLNEIGAKMEKYQ